MGHSSTAFGYPISELPRPEVVAESLKPAPQGGGATLIVTMNVDNVVTLNKNPRFRAAYDFASMVVADGVPVLIVARLKGIRAHRVTGADMTVDFAKRLVPGVHRPFYVVSQPAVGERLAEAFVARGFQRQDVGYLCPPLGFEADAEESAKIARAIREFGPTHLFMGVGAPKSEIWIHEHRHDLGDLRAFCFGAGLDFLAGTQKRAPKLVSNAGFEWLWRLLSQPRRLWRRYLVNSWGFVPQAVGELLARR